MLVLVHFTVFYFQFLLSCYIRAYEVLSFLSHCASLSFQPFFGISFWCPIVFLIVRSPKMLLTHSSFSCEKQKAEALSLPTKVRVCASYTHTRYLTHSVSLSFPLVLTPRTASGFGLCALPTWSEQCNLLHDKEAAQMRLAEKFQDVQNNVLRLLRH